MSSSTVSCSLEACWNVQGALGSHDLHVPSYDAWDGLSLTYDVKWPLHILLTPEVSKAYSCSMRYSCQCLNYILSYNAWSHSCKQQQGSD